MTTQQNQENNQLVEIKNLISDRFNQLERRIDESTAELKQDIIETKAELKQKITEVKGDIKAVHVEVKGLEKRLSMVETSVAKIPEITEKFGELKNWRQIALVVIAGVISAFLGWMARSGRV